jgi:hypothetical protein
VQTTERYLGCKQNLGHPVNDLFHLEPDAQQQSKPDDSIPATPTSEAVENIQEPGIECRHGGSEDARPICDTKQVSVPERTELVESGKGHRPEDLRRCSETGTSGSHAGSKRDGEQNQGTRRRVDLERYLTQRRKDIDRRFEFRSSRLTQVFGVLLSERRIRAEELRGLQEKKIKAIRSCVKALSEDAA